MSDDMLFNAARAFGLETSYRNAHGRNESASPESLRALLACLGVGTSTRDLREAVALRRIGQATRLCEPVVVGHVGRPVSIELRLQRLSGQIKLEGRSEDSVQFAEEAAATDLAVEEEVAVDGSNVYLVRLPVKQSLPVGYYRIRVTVNEQSASSLLMIAPPRAFSIAPQAWGVFAPVYSLRSERNWGSGDIADVARFARVLGAAGASYFATLPLLASYLSQPFDQSPYSPVSRCFWNELYLDVEALPEFEMLTSAERDSLSIEATAQRLRRAERVDYRGVMALKRRVLERLAAHHFGGAVPTLQSYLDQSPETVRYARFRAAMDNDPAGWRQWSTPISEEASTWDDATRRSVLYHLYAQTSIQRQMQSCAAAMEANGVHWYLDLPLGVNPDAYDVWCDPESFLVGCALGAPPDLLSEEGQNWGLSPLHPDVIRERGYDYFIRSIRHHMCVAGALRIDHVMSLYRVFCIPEGMDGRSGVYVRFRSEELFAILAIESHLNKCALIGEDLGTVPPQVRAAMKRWSMLRMHVLQFAADEDPIPEPDADCCTSINTHDMVPFAAWWDGAEVGHRDEGPGSASPAPSAVSDVRSASKIRLSTWADSQSEKPGQEDAAKVLPGILRKMAESDAAFVLVSDGDLALDTVPQNVPGTCSELNWDRRMALTLDAFSQDERTRSVLGDIARLRTRSKPTSGGNEDAS